jgi:hypothetical protein
VAPPSAWARSEQSTAVAPAEIAAAEAFAAAAAMAAPRGVGRVGFKAGWRRARRPVDKKEISLVFSVARLEAQEGRLL